MVKGNGVAKAFSQHVRSAFEREGTCLRPVYTHGNPSVAPCKAVLLPCGEGARLLRWTSSKLVMSSWSLSSEDSAVAVSLSPSGDVGALVGRSGLMDLVEFNTQTPRLRKRFRPFERSIATIAEFDASGGLLALATRDGHIRVYDVDTCDCTHVFRSPNAPLSIIAFHPIPERLQLFVGTEDGAVQMYDLKTRERSPKLSVQHHVGSVVAFCFTEAGETVVSASRDKTLCAMHSKTLKRIRLFATEEILSGLCAESEEGSRVISVSEGGALRYWDVKLGIGKEEEKTQLPLVRAKVNMEGTDYEDDDETVVIGMRVFDDEESGFKVLVSLSDQTLLIIHLRMQLPPVVVDLISGNLQEIYDIAPISMSSDSKNTKPDLVVASNSSSLWIMRPPSLAADGETWSCVAGLHGHGGVVLSIDSMTSRKALGGSNATASAYIASGSRDTTARVWRRSRVSGNWSCIGIAKGHAEAVGGIALSPNSSKGLFYVATAAADRTLKLWSLDRALQNAEKAEGKNSFVGATEGFCFSKDHSIELSAKWTVLAHEKDINAVAVSPDAHIIATGSQDKTLKLWNYLKGKLHAVCSGHRRGIWDVSFSSVDKIVASSSGDATIRIWSVQNGSCLRTLEGHLSGVLKTIFISNGTQIVSSGADGLLKIWQARSGECDHTIDAHEDRVWALTSPDDGQRLFSGAADGTLSTWDDCTVQKAEEAAAQREQQTIMAQQVSNAVFARRWADAARGALELGMPQKLKLVIEGLITSSDDADGELTAMIHGLVGKIGNSTEAELVGVENCEAKTTETKDSKSSKLVTQLCIYCRDWNATGGPRSAALASRTLQAVFRSWKPSELSELVNTDKRPLLEAFIAHGSRHYDRVSALGTKVMFVEHVLESMKSLPESAVKKDSRKRKKNRRVSDENGNKVKRKKNYQGLSTEY